jgi:hypothetical protein
MSLNTFTPQIDTGVVGGNIPVFADSKCTQRVAVFDTNGRPLPGNALASPDDGIPQAFQASQSTVYFRAGNGVIVSLTSAGVHAASTPGGTPVTLALEQKGV